MAVRTLGGVLVVAALGGCSSKAERIETSLRKGNQYVQQYDWDKANVEARNVLQMDPKNAGAYLIVARIQDAKNDYRGAYGAYQKVLELNPGSVEAKLGTARLYLVAGEFDRARALIDALLAQDPSGVRAQALHAALQAGLKNRDGALAEADKILAANAELPPDASTELAGLYFNAKLEDKAQETVDRALKVSPNDLQIVQLGATMAALSSRPDSLQRADRLYQKATELSPHDDRLWLEWSTVYLMKTKDLDRAEGVLRSALKVDPDNAQRQVALLNFISVNRDAKTAEQAWLKAIDDHPKESNLRLALADFYKARQRPDDAIKTLQAIVDQGKDKPEGITARGRIAAILLERHQRGQALAMLNEVLKSNPRDSLALLLRGQIERDTGDAQASIIDLRAALRDRPGDVQVAALLAGAHHEAGEHQLAREVLADLVKFNPKVPTAHLLLANDMMGTGEWTAAESEVDAAIQAAPTDLEAYKKKVELHVRQNDFAGAEAEARSVVQKFPKAAGAQVLLARTLAVAGKIDAAVTAFDAA
ncbi:MAG: tetratricopeptide repeat protein, partial [Hyphomicrobiales bacterium]|nr:tetratricopeptide repeat protein [Hyphomicrobiales bacterium]